MQEDGIERKGAKMKKRWIAVLVVALLSLGVSAQTVDESDAEHRAAAQRLLQVTEAKKMMDQVLDSMDGMLDQSFSSLELNPDGVEAARQAQDEMMAWVRDFLAWEELEPMYVELYAKVFTTEEILGIIEFYESPLGQKMLAKMPELMTESMSMMQSRITEKMPELQRRIEQSVERLKLDYGDTH